MKKSYLFIFGLLISMTLVLSCSKNEDQIYIPVVDNLPVVTDDVINSTLENSIEIPILANDVSGDLILANSVSITNGIDTDNNGTLDKLSIENQGIWTVNPVSGNITFTSASNFLGNPIMISYTARDAQNNLSQPANVVINVLPITNLNIDQAIFNNLSEYKFFVGDMKNQYPALNVIPYEPASSLFTDYAKKKRFVWMPSNTKATFNDNNKVLELPVGAVLIKTFYYDNVQPDNTTRIMETRLMIRKTTGWIFAEYIWNAAQTDAVLDLSGSTSAVSWKDENNTIKNVNYRFPNSVQCIACHKNSTPGGVEYVPIGIKPQNLNTDFKFGTETKNQLSQWISSGKVDNFVLPSIENSTVNYKDVTKSLAVRARSYVDINCAHCHQVNKFCDYRIMRFAFSDTAPTNAANQVNLGICQTPGDFQGTPLSNYPKIISPRNINQSMLYYRINTTNETYRMPLHGRTIIHTEGVELMKQWINSLTTCR